MGVVTSKTSTIFVSVGDRLEVFRSWEEIPAEVQHQLRSPSAGQGRMKVIIANRGGKAVISRALDEKTRFSTTPRLRRVTKAVVNGKAVVAVCVAVLCILIAWLIFLFW